jgi:signal transduction histidine kinase
MNKNEITFEDLQARIHNFIDKAKEAKEDIHFAFEVDTVLKLKSFSSVEGMNLYRTIQEAINNSIKYAQPQNITVSIKPSSKGIVIVITDDGKGFDKDEVVLGNGIQNMQKRIQNIGGHFELISSPNQGTQILIEI